MICDRSKWVKHKPEHPFGAPFVAPAPRKPLDCHINVWAYVLPLWIGERDVERRIASYKAAFVNDGLTIEDLEALVAYELQESESELEESLR